MILLAIIHCHESYHLPSGVFFVRFGLRIQHPVTCQIVAKQKKAAYTERDSRRDTFYSFVITPVRSMENISRYTRGNAGFRLLIDEKSLKTIPECLKP